MQPQFPRRIAVEDHYPDELREDRQAQPDLQPDLRLQLEKQRLVDQLAAVANVKLHKDRQAQPAPQLENRQRVDQLDSQPGVEGFQKHPAVVLLNARPDLFARQGSINPTWRHRNGVAFGPYYRLAYRENGRQHAVYLGREGPLVDRVRKMLASLQKPLRTKRMFDRLEREARSGLRANNARLAVLLRPLGLRLKGCEIRGWRTALLPKLRFTVPKHAKCRGVPVGQVLRT